MTRVLSVMASILNENKKRNMNMQALTGYDDCKQKKMKKDNDCKLEEKKKDNITRLWSHLPDDILRSLISKMTLVDQIRFCAVCKNWNIPINDIPPVDKLPWMMLCRWTTTRSVCKLYDPSHQKIYVVEESYKQEARKKFAGADVCASKYGWVLCSVKRKDAEDNTSTTFFVYSPFTNDVIDLPELGMDFKKATFSSTPTSQDCLFFAVSKIYNECNAKIVINTCQRGDKNWKTFNVDDLCCSVSDVAYMEGIFYCLLNGEVLGAFNVALQEWHLLYSGPSIDDQLGPPYMYDLVVSDGQLLRVHFKDDLKWRVFRFDRQQENWVKEKSLGNRAIFVGDCNSFSLAAVGEASEYADTLAYKEHSPYSFKTSSYKTDMDFWDKRICSEVHQEGLERVWIEPPQLSF